MVTLPGLCPGPRWVSLQCSPNPLAGNNQCNIQNCYVTIGLSYILEILHSCRPEENFPILRPEDLLPGLEFCIQSHVYTKIFFLENL